MYPWKTRSQGVQNLLLGSGSCNNGHGNQEDGILNRRDDKVASDDLQELVAWCSTSCEGLLKRGNQEVP